MFNSYVNSFFEEEDGQDLVEYALLLAFVATAAVALVGALKGPLATVWTKVTASLTTASAS